jgi:poly(A) polymerase/tRNA nucleotidyltransferase (CCA-adding enzyme)
VPARISPERIRDELNRLLNTDVPERAVGMMGQLGLLAAVLPEVAALAGVEQSPPHHEAVLPHTLSVLRYLTQVERLVDERPVAAGWAESLGTALQPYRPGLKAHAATMVDGSFSGRMLLRWGALLHDAGKATTQTIDEMGRIRFLGHDEAGAQLAQARLNRLNFGNEATRRVRDVVAGHMRPLFLAADGKRPSRRAVYRFFRALRAAGLDVIILAAADHLATHDGQDEAGDWERLLVVLQTLLENYFTAFSETVAPVRLLNGQDVMGLLQLEPGRELGRLLALLEEAQAAGEVTTRDEAIDFLHRRRDP